MRESERLRGSDGGFGRSREGEGFPMLDLDGIRCIKAI